MPKNKFTIRVYGLLINEQHQVLVTDEIYASRRLTKFPGGGLEFGEGTIECLKRECMEEMGQEIEVLEHFYTTDFFQPSIFSMEYQVICIYYLIKPKQKLAVEIKQRPFDFTEEKDGSVVFRLIPMTEILKEPFTFENDRRVSKMLNERYKK